MSKFKEFGLPSFIVESLQKSGISDPTPIQSQVLPLALQGHDILASAQTGSGKTLAFLLPLVVKILKANHDKALILAPTRELAIQVNDTFRKLGGRNNLFNSALLIGGESIYKQFGQLKRSPKLFIGTPGRITDHLKRRTLILKEVKFLVIDEMDRMLDMGFSEQLEEIIHYLPKERQTSMYSATMPSNIIKLSQKYLSNPQRISIGSTTQPAAQIKQDTIHTPASKKLSHLLEQLERRAGSIIVFVKTKRGAVSLANELRNNNHKVAAIHGDLMQSKRDQVMRAFRECVNRILVATDIAARGLDVPHIQHVINYDLPQCAEDYIHRIGRTGRAGVEGHALSLIAPEDNRKWKVIHKLIFGVTNDEEKCNDKFKRRKKSYKNKSNFSFKGKKFNKSRKNKD